MRPLTLAVFDILTVGWDNRETPGSIRHIDKELEKKGLNEKEGQRQPFMWYMVISLNSPVITMTPRLFYPYFHIFLLHIFCRGVKVVARSAVFIK